MPTKITRLLNFICIIMIFSGQANAQVQKTNREFYQIRLYHFSTPTQEAVLDKYFADAFIPAMHRLGIKHIGAFKPIANDTTTDKRLYILVPLESLNQLTSLLEQLARDAAYTKAAEAYTDASNENAPYNRIETIILRAFRLAPKSGLPQLKSGKNDRVYELRNYESATEKKYWNKVHMFNEGGEIPLFKRLNFNAVFYGEVIAGSRMPNLMYMTSFESIADREAHWQTFRDDAQWKELSARPEYKNNVIKNEQILTRATPYSDF